MTSPSQNSGTNRAARQAPTARPAPKLTKARDWIDARQAGARLPQHVLPEDTDVLIWTQAMEQRP